MWVVCSCQMYDELRMEEECIMQQSAKLECSLKGVLREQFLRKFISDTHWDSLVLPPVSPNLVSVPAGKKEKAFPL